MENETSAYITSGGGLTGTSGTVISTDFSWNNAITVDNNGYISFRGSVKKDASGIHPELYFKYIKSKFGILEKMRLDARLKKLEKAFFKAVESGQEMLGNKLMNELTRETRESLIYAKGIKYFIEKSDLDKHKRNIRGGHISDTKLQDFTRVIPEEVLAKKKKTEGCFDGYVIYHYYNEEVEKGREKKQKMSADEKQKMRDPVLFGVIRETNRLYFIADWEDELCDLTFEEMIDHLGKEESEVKLSREPKLQ